MTILAGACTNLRDFYWDEQQSWDVTTPDWQEEATSPVPYSVGDAGKAPLLHSQLDAAIVESRDLLRLQENWDDAGAPPVNEQALERAIEFLVRYSKEVWISTGRDVEVPSISAGPDGSIDVHWRTITYELLVNFPDGNAPAGFYGDNYGHVRIKGAIDSAGVNKGLLAWLAGE